MLKVGDRATFQAYDGRRITGKVIAVTHSCYLVLGDDDFCYTYNDGLFRFQDRNIVRDR
jgi:hypothetical protein